jgi:lipopolysaccharide cholinephosphotransferase
MEEKLAVENLRAVKDVFDRNEIDFWLEHGTLLGAVRDGKILNWDSDVDLGAWYTLPSHFTVTFDEFKKLGFNVVLNPKQGVVTMWKGDCNINLNFYRRRSGYAWTTWIPDNESKLRRILQRGMNISNFRSYAIKENNAAGKSKHFLSMLPSALKRQLADFSWLALRSFGYMVPVVIPAHYFEQLSSISFYGMQFRVPSDVKKYLEYRYGADWRTPNKNWVYYRDDGAVNRNWDTRYFGT